MPGPEQAKSGNHFSSDEMRTKLEKVLANKDNFYRSAAASFKQFDKDGNQQLDFQECKKLIDRLCQNLQLPPVDDDTLSRIFHRYDFTGDGTLVFDEFAQLYYSLLCRIRDKFYPAKRLAVRRHNFVKRHVLGEDGTTSVNDILEFTKKLGQGSFGQVHLVREKKTGLMRVCKTINKDKSALPVEQIEEEIKIMKELDHPNIIKIYEVLDDFHNIYILMELCEGGELLGRLAEAHKQHKRLTEETVANIMQQLLSALSYMHKRKVIHKDLKPENLLFVDKSDGSPIKLIDFGLAEMFEAESANSRNAAGTALYMAPEVYSRNFNFKCDIWSAGILMYILLTGRLPFMGKTIEEVRDKVCKEPVPFKTDCGHVSPAAQDLMRKMLEKNPKLRLTADQCLEHPWFTSSVAMRTELSPEIAQNFRSYMKQSALKNALINMLAHQLNVNYKQLKTIQDLFYTFDRDHSGTISEEEMTEALGKAGIPQWDITRILQAMDVDNDKNISYTEFVAACWSWQEQELNQVWSAFTKMDLDGDGCLTVDEFVQVLMGDDAKQKLINKEDFEDMVRQIDTNGNGKIEWDEFVAFMKGQPQVPVPVPAIPGAQASSGAAR